MHKLVLTLIFFAAAPLWAKSIGLNDLIAVAWKNNSYVLAKGYDIDISKNASYAEGALFHDAPDFESSVYTGAAYDDSNDFRIQLMFRFPFEMAGQSRLRADVADSNADVAALERQNVRLVIAYALRQSLLQIAQIDAELSQLKAMKNVDDRRHTQLDIERHAIVSEIEHITGCNIDVENINTQTDFTPFDFSLDESINKALSSSLTAQVAQKNVSIRKTQALLARKELFPDVSLSVGYGAENLYDETTEGEYYVNHLLVVGVGIPFPMLTSQLWHADGAKIAIEKEKRLLKEEQRILKRDVKIAHHNMNAYHKLAEKMALRRQKAPAKSESWLSTWRDEQAARSDAYLAQGQLEILTGQVFVSEADIENQHNQTLSCE